MLLCHPHRRGAATGNTSLEGPPQLFPQHRPPHRGRRAALLLSNTDSSRCRAGFAADDSRPPFHGWGTLPRASGGPARQEQDAGGARAEAPRETITIPPVRTRYSVGSGCVPALLSTLRGCGSAGGSLARRATHQPPQMLLNGRSQDGLHLLHQLVQNMNLSLQTAHLSQPPEAG